MVGRGKAKEEPTMPLEACVRLKTPRPFSAPLSEEEAVKLLRELMRTMIADGRLQVNTKVRVESPPCPKT